MPSWRTSSIKATDEHLLQWLGSIVQANAPCLLTPPDAAPKTPQVNACLVDILDAPALRNSSRPPLQVTLRYLVSTWAPDPLDAHDLLNLILFAALDEPELEVELSPLAPEVWLAFGVPPRPAFFLRLPVRLERPEPPLRAVRHPLQVQAIPVVPLFGRILGPEDTPVMAARIEIPSLLLSASSDSEGRFRFTAIPAGNWIKRLRVKARGRILDVALERTYPEEDPLIVHFDLLK
jgi:hypothetical protein